MSILVHTFPRSMTQKDLEAYSLRFKLINNTAELNGSSCFCHQSVFINRGQTGEKEIPVRFFVNLSQGSSIKMNTYIQMS